MSTQPQRFLTPEDYLAIEREAERKSEYLGGEMFAMAGARESHNLIVANAVAQLWQQLRSRLCRVYPSDMRVRTATGLYTYPDAIVVCGEPRFLDHRRDTLLNPNLIVEVLSSSTEGYDRGRKFEHYQSIETLNAYLMPASDRVHADLYTKQANGQWLLNSTSKPDDLLEVESVGCRLRLADLYEKVELDNQP